MSKQLERDCFKEYEKGVRNKIEDDLKCHGPFHDSVNPEDYVDVPMANVRVLHQTIGEKKELYDSGLEYVRVMAPDIVSLEEKEVSRKTYKEVLALAGVAKIQQKTTFDMIEERIANMRKQASNILNDAKILEGQLIYLRKLAVLD